MSTDAELKRIRERRIQELRKQISEEQSKSELDERAEAQKQSLLRRILTIDARERLNRIRMVRPDFVGQLELELIQVARSGRIRIPITDQQLKVMLSRFQSVRREITFRRI